MKKLYTLILTLFTLATVAQTASFEGELRFVTTNKDIDETAQVVWLRGAGMNKMVYNTVTKGLPTQFSLVFGDSDVNMTLLAEANGQKKRYNIPVSALQNNALASAYKVVLTEQTQTVAGYPTMQYVLEQPGATTTCYIGNIAGLGVKDLPLPMQTGIAKALAGNNITGVPFSINTIDSKTGETRFSQTLQSVTPRPINKAEFTIGPEWIAE